MNGEVKRSLRIAMRKGLTDPEIQNRLTDTASRCNVDQLIVALVDEIQRLHMVNVELILERSKCGASN